MPASLNSEPEITATIACLMCKCGWIMAVMLNDEYHCDNPKCKNRARVYKIEVKLIEVEAKIA